MTNLYTNGYKVLAMIEQAMVENNASDEQFELLYKVWDDLNQIIELKNQGLN